MKNLPTKPAERFIALVEGGINLWVDAGVFLVNEEKENPSLLKEILAAAPWIEQPTLEMFLKIGRGEIHPKVLLLPPMVAAQVAKLPIKQQERLADKPVQTIRREVKELVKAEELPPVNKHERHESGLADKMATVGFWKVTVMNGKAFMVRTADDRRAIPMVLDETSSCYIQILSPTPKKKIPAPIIADKDMTPLEREYKKFKNGN